jgi:hypothetical protein
MPATLEESSRLDKKLGSRKHIVLRCMIYEECATAFVAECIDLDIIVKAKTPEGAEQSLQAALIGYLKTVAELGDESLLRRPSPFSHRLRYHLCCLRAAFMSSHNKFRLYDWSPTNCTA